MIGFFTDIDFKCGKLLKSNHNSLKHLIVKFFVYNNSLSCLLHFVSLLWHYNEYRKRKINETSNEV